MNYNQQIPPNYIAKYLSIRMQFIYNMKVFDEQRKRQEQTNRNLYTYTRWYSRYAIPNNDLFSFVYATYALIE